MVRNAFTMAEPARRCYLAKRFPAKWKPVRVKKTRQIKRLKIPTEGMAMRDEMLKEKVRITAGAVTAPVIVGWLAIVAVALMSVL